MSIDEEWANLCHDFQVADAEYVKAWEVIALNFEALAKDGNASPPTEQKIITHELSYSNRVQTENRISEFIELHFQS